ncbi:MAG: arginine--tRNA ligase, partial [Minisyncoccia bacterium]
MEEKIREAIAEALAKAGAEGIEFAVERPASATHGDYATNAAMVAAKSLGKNPHSLADSLAPLIEDALGETAGKVEVAGPGFINITLSKGTVGFLITEADAKGEDWGKGPQVQKKVLIEYSNPNAFKEMHAGHLVGTVTGEALSRLIENGGAQVARDTFGGDVGPNVAKALWGLRKAGDLEPQSAAEIGEAYAVGAQAYENNEKAKVE